MSWISFLLGYFYDMFFGCRHSRLTRPFTLEKRTYKVCLECGKQIDYSTERMRPLTESEVRRQRAAHGGVVTVIPERGSIRRLFPRRTGKSDAAA